MLSVLLAPYVLPRRRQIAVLWCEHRLRLAIIGAVVPIASALVLYAMQLAPVSVVAPVREISIVVGGVAAWLWLGEPDPGRRLTGAVIVLAGITAIVVG